MQYRQLAEVSNFVSDNGHDLDEVLQLLCVKALATINAGGVVFVAVNRQGYVTPQTSFGFELKDASGTPPAFHISERTPFTDAIRENRVIVVNTLPVWPKAYTQMSSFGFPEHFRSLVVCPVNIDGLPVGCLSTFAHSKIQLDGELTDFLEAITIIIAGWFRRNTSSNPNVVNHPARFNSERRNHQDLEKSSIDNDGELTERQMLILKLITEGRTNAAIADLLGYSESLIRQETIKIYAKLHCSGRNEAAQIYHRMEAGKEPQAV